MPSGLPPLAALVCVLVVCDARADVYALRIPQVPRPIVAVRWAQAARDTQTSRIQR